MYMYSNYIVMVQNYRLRCTRNYMYLTLKLA